MALDSNLELQEVTEWILC